MKNLSCKKNSKKSKVTLMLNERSPLSSSLKNNKTEFQRSISSTSNANFMSILRFEGERFENVPGQYFDEIQFEKNFLNFPAFF